MPQLLLELEAGHLAEYFPDEFAILAGIHAASGVDDPATRFDSVERRRQESLLNLCQLSEFAGYVAPADFGAFTQNTGVRTRDIDQDPIEWSLRDITAVFCDFASLDDRDPQSLTVLLDQRQTAFDCVAGHN